MRLLKKIVTSSVIYFYRVDDQGSCSIHFVLFVITNLSWQPNPYFLTNNFKEFL